MRLRYFNFFMKMHSGMDIRYKCKPIFFYNGNDCILI